MFLTTKSPSPLKLFPSTPFEESLTTRLNSLLPLPSPSLPLSFLSRALHLLTLTLADATLLISHSSPDPSLLRSSLPLLDACNALSAAIDRILARRLLIRLALRLLSSSLSDRIPRARSAIAQWESANSDSSKPINLRKLRTRGRVTAVGRAGYAVEAMAGLVAGVGLALLGERGDFAIGVCGSKEFGWAAAFNEVAERVSARGCCSEIEKMRRSVRRLAVSVDEGDCNGGLVDAVRGGEEAVEELTEGMEGLGDAVKKVFRGVLEMREVALEGFRVRAERCS